VNSAKLFSENSQTKTRAHERMPPLRVCLARPNELQHWLGPLRCVGSPACARRLALIRAKIQEQCGAIDPGDDRHQRAGGPVNGSRYTLPDVEPNEEVSAAPIQTSLQAILVLGRSLKIIANRTVIESRERRKIEGSKQDRRNRKHVPKTFCHSGQKRAKQQRNQKQRIRCRAPYQSSETAP
jgi:hypothetical protein